MEFLAQNASTDALPIIFLNKKTLKKQNTPLLKNNNFSAKNGQIVVGKSTLIVGTQGVKTADDWRILGMKITQKLKLLEVKNAVINVPKKCGAFVEGLVLGDYEFNTYKSEKKKSKLKNIYLESADDITTTVEKAISHAEAQCLTRDWVNTTPEDANSDTIESAVRKMFKNTSVEVDVYGEKELKRLGMNMHLAVNRASRHKAKTIKLTYTPPKWDSKNDKHHVMVMKTLTYDSGGLSIKPGNHMTSMKADKSAGMVGWGVMSAISNLGSKSKITMYLGVAENMIDGSAYKPDDVLIAMNGKTVHVKNTDAEGRLVLFDNLCLAQKENKKFTTISSWATLTGAAVFQFGNEAAGMVGFNDKLKKQIKTSGDKCGEIFMNAEFHKYMLDGVDDSLADLSNTGSAGQGCQKAGLFLTNAITKKNKNNYIHLDIAGPSFVEKAFGSNPSGGTGFGVRTILDFLNR